MLLLISVNIIYEQRCIDSFGTTDSIIKCENATTNCPLKESLWLCMQSFNLKSSSMNLLDFKRIWVFTNDDSPHANDPSEQNRIVQVAKDGAETGVEISLWCMDHKQPFNSSKFYDRLLIIGTDAALDDNEGENMESILSAKKQSAGYDNFDSMLAQVRRKEFKKRRLCTMCVYMSNDSSMMTSLSNAKSGEKCHRFAVGFYKTVTPAKRPVYKWLQVMILIITEIFFILISIILYHYTS